MTKKILSEAATRNNILEYARHLGCEGDVLKIFAKYDNLLRNCTNPMERQAISYAGNEELHMFLDAKAAGTITVGNKIIASK